MIRGSTELVAIVGSPIAQVKSPENFNTWFNHNNCNLAMLPFDLHEAALDSFADTLRGWQNLRGCVVTVPYKQALANRVDGLSERAAALGSVNVIRRERDGRLLGDNVDGAGFLGAAHKHGFEPAGKRALVIGCGGVGSAIAYALAEAGIASITLSDPSTARMGAVCELLGNGFPGSRSAHSSMGWKTSTWWPTRPQSAWAPAQSCRCPPPCWLPCCHTPWSPTWSPHPR